LSKLFVLEDEFSGKIVEYQSCGEFISPPTVKNFRIFGHKNLEL
jgi:hypothetical protein